MKQLSPTTNEALSWLTLDTWITSDHHWEHPRIGGYQNRPENHFDLMRECWLERVGDEDTLFHLGDVVCFGDRSRHAGWLAGLPGRKYLIRGNHDGHSANWYEAAGFTVLGRKPRYWLSPLDGKRICFSHEPEVERLDWAINVHGHVHGNDHRGALPDRDYRNVSVEVTDYAPVRLRDVLYGELAREAEDNHDHDHDQQDPE